MFLIRSSWLLFFALITSLFSLKDLIINVGLESTSHRIVFFHFIIFYLDSFIGFIFGLEIYSENSLKKYEVLLIIVLLFGGFLVPEALLFVSFFWTSVHSLSCPTLGTPKE